MRSTAEQAQASSFRRAMRTDADAKSGDRTMAELAPLGSKIQLRLYHWPATDEVDAELRRAAAYRHGCFTVDDEFLVGSADPADFDRCAMSYGAFAANVAHCGRGPHGRPTTSVLEYLTLVAAQFVTMEAVTKRDGKRCGADTMSTIFGFLGVDSRAPNREVRAPQNAREESAVNELLTALRVTCGNTTDIASRMPSAPAVPEPKAEAPAIANPARTKPRVNVPHLRLVK
jgi:hypothetical protein